MVSTCSKHEGFKKYLGWLSGRASGVTICVMLVTKVTLVNKEGEERNLPCDVEMLSTVSFLIFCPTELTVVL